MHHDNLRLYSQEGAMEEARAENESLKEKINGLKQQYGPIGKQVCCVSK